MVSYVVYAKISTDWTMTDYHYHWTITKQRDSKNAKLFFPSNSQCTKNQQIISFSGTSTHTYLKCLTAFSPRSSKPVQTHVTLFFIFLFLLVFRALKKMKLKIQCSKNSKCRLTSCTSLAMFILRMKLHVIILHN